MTLQFLKGLGLAAMTALLGLTANAATVQIGGVKAEESITIYNNTLLLNGAGTVVNGKVPLYVAKMYAKQKFTTLDQLFVSPGPKRLVITAVKDVDTAPIMKLFNRNVELLSDKKDMAKLLPGLMRLGKIFGDVKTIKPGESLVFDWTSYSGLVIYLDSKLLGEPFKDPEFFRAAMSIWMGELPADAELKAALLGKT